MSPHAETPLSPTAILDDIERRVTEIFSAQKNEVEQSLVERINREKEEAQKRIDAVNREFVQVRSLLEEHKATMAGLETTEEHLRGEIRGHFERAVNYQKMMENAAALAGGELEKIGGLHEELETLRAKAESEYRRLKERLAGYAGIVAQIPPPPAIKAEEGEVDWIEEIGKLRKVRDLLATLRGAGAAEAELAEEPDDASPASSAAAETQYVEPEPSTPEAETAEALAASLGLVQREDDGVHDDAEFAENDPALAGIGTGAPEYVEFEAPEAAGTAETASEPAASDAAGLGFTAPDPLAETREQQARDAAVLAALARYRRSEPINNGVEIGFFATETAAYLDAGSLMDAIGKIIEGASELHAQLVQTTSVKDLFLLKQEILNQQEILRKLFFRVVRFCEKESGRLPASLAEIVGSRGLKDIIERLTMANWSDPSDFKPFLNELKAMKKAFEVRMACSASYLQSVLDEVEGREN